ncbi:ATP-binding protein [Streptomyces sp. NPDC059104]|uniref:ATP-binding protein n=1 Tax=Streptomyces sp. NPDC059104 TaxID=3346729 RepID=UPI00367AD4B6
MASQQAHEAFWFVPRSPRAPGRARALLLSELVTNAVRYAGAPQGRDIGVRVARYGGVLRVEVADAGDPVELAPRAAGACDEGGRGLAIVAALSVRWGLCPRRHGIGKAVWAEITGAPEGVTC